MPCSTRQISRIARAQRRRPRSAEAARPGPRQGWRHGRDHLADRDGVPAAAPVEGRKLGPLFVTERKTRVQLAAADLDEHGHARLSYQQAAALFSEASGGATLHQLRHSALTHDAEDGAGTPMLMARSAHTSVRSLAKHAPGLGRPMPARLPIRVLSTKATCKAAKRLGIPTRRSGQPFQAKGVTPDRVLAARRRVQPTAICMQSMAAMLRWPLPCRLWLLTVMRRSSRDQSWPSTDGCLQTRNGLGTFRA